MVDEESRKRSFPDMDENGGTAKMGRFNRGKEPLLKLLVPDIIAGHIIGKGGKGLTELKNQYGGHLVLSNHKEHYPGTRERVVVITGKLSELVDINHYIMDKMVNVDPSLSNNERFEEIRTNGRGDKTLMVVTQTSSGIVIGRGGSTVKEIKEKTGARVDIADSHEGERILTITGSFEQRSEASKQIIDKIAQELTNMANTKTKYNNETQRGSHGPGGRPANPTRIDEGAYNMPNMPNMPVHKSDNLVNMIGNAAASLDKHQILAALTGHLGLGGGGGGLQQQQQQQQHNPSNNLPRSNALESQVEVNLNVPNYMVGYLMGKGGSGVKEMRYRSDGAKFTFEANDATAQSNGSAGTRKLTITGTFEQTTKGYHLVHDKLEDWQQQPQQQQQQHGFHPTEY